MTEARVGYVADTEAEVNSVGESIGGDHVLFCDRVSVPRTVGDKAAEGMTTVSNLRGKRKSIMTAGGKEVWELEIASRACFCTVCSARDSIDQKCPYHELRQVRTINVSDQSNDEEWREDHWAKRAVTTYFRGKKVAGYINMEMMRQELK